VKWTSGPQQVRRDRVTTTVPASRHLLRARDLIDARYRDPLDIAELARVAHCSPAHFSRRFDRTFGSPPHRYLLERRVERAKHLLASTDASVLEIALDTGFHSAPSFCTAFKRVSGTTPGAYRRLASDRRHSQVPTCVLMAWTRPVLEVSRNGKDDRAHPG
jgi:AraC-like DNA-binding protein